MILFIDNYDSFVHNLARYFRRLGQETRVVRNDAITPAEIRRLGPDALVLSPGPCTPSEAGCSLEVVRELSGHIPTLGVCLGHQVIGEAFGGRIVRAKEPVHGRSSSIGHDKTGIFSGLENPLTVGRYHSLVVEECSLPAELSVTARTGDGTIMALSHRQHLTFGVQFHPESILTRGGYQLLANFLRLAGIVAVNPPPDYATEQSKPAVRSIPAGPVTF